MARPSGLGAAAWRPWASRQPPWSRAPSRRRPSAPREPSGLGLLDARRGSLRLDPGRVQGGKHLLAGQPLGLGDLVNALLASFLSAPSRLGLLPRLRHPRRRLSVGRRPRPRILGAFGGRPPLRLLGVLRLVRLLLLGSSGLLTRLLGGLRAPRPPASASAIRPRLGWANSASARSTRGRISFVGVGVGQLRDLLVAERREHRHLVGLEAGQRLVLGQAAVARARRARRSGSGRPESTAAQRPSASSPPRTRARPPPG